MFDDPPTYDERYTLLDYYPKADMVLATYANGNVTADILMPRVFMIPAARDLIAAKIEIEPYQFDAAQALAEQNVESIADMIYEGDVNKNAVYYTEGKLWPKAAVDHGLSDVFKAHALKPIDLPEVRTMLDELGLCHVTICRDDTLNNGADACARVWREDEKTEWEMAFAPNIPITPAMVWHEAAHFKTSNFNHYPSFCADYVDIVRRSHPQLGQLLHDSFAMLDLMATRMPKAHP